MTINFNNSWTLHSYFQVWVFFFGLAFLVNLVNYLALWHLSFKKIDSRKNNNKTNSDADKNSSNSSSGDDDSWWKTFVKGFLVFVAGSLTTLIVLWFVGFDFDLTPRLDPKILEQNALQKEFIEYYISYAQYDFNVNHIQDNSELFDTLVANGITSRGELAVLTHRAEEWRTLLEGMTSENFDSYVDTLHAWSSDHGIQEDLYRIDNLINAIDIELANVSSDVSEASE